MFFTENEVRSRFNVVSKSCSEDNLERVTDTQHYNPLIHQHFRESKIQVVLLLTKGHEVNPAELFQAVVQTKCEEMASSWGKSQEVRSSNYSRGPNSRV